MKHPNCFFVGVCDEQKIVIGTNNPDELSPLSQIIRLFSWGPWNSENPRAEAAKKVIAYQSAGYTSKWLA